MVMPEASLPEQARRMSHDVVPINVMARHEMNRSEADHPAARRTEDGRRIVTVIGNPGPEFATEIAIFNAKPRTEEEHRELFPRIPRSEYPLATPAEETRQ